MKIIKDKLYVTLDDAERGALGEPVLSVTLAILFGPDGPSDAPEPVSFDDQDHYDADELRAFIGRTRS